MEQKKGPESQRNSGPWSFFIEKVDQLHNGSGPTHKVSKPETELLIAVNHVFIMVEITPNDKSLYE
ncbi:MAG: hypothetical protein COA78_24465 [Blastopirellula sp.]|nr:MAG: hypothetical protein COA78_24465 [Blastopirellula sp.]